MFPLQRISSCSYRPLLWILSCMPIPALAQEPISLPSLEKNEAQGKDDKAIIVEGQRQEQKAGGEVPPERVLEQEEILSLGVTNISRLVDAISKVTGAQVVTLVNGRRTSGPDEIAGIPTEAVKRVEIFPAEVALRYGYSADQKVVNVVLVDFFHAIIGQTSLSLATEGGRETPAAEVTVQTISSSNRFNLVFSAEHAPKLLESQRNVIPIASSPQFALGGNIYGIPVPGLSEIDPALSNLVGARTTVAAVPDSAAGGRPALDAFRTGANRPALSDLGDFRTLSPQTNQFSGRISYTRTIVGIYSTLSGSLARTESTLLQGLEAARLTIPAGNPFSPFAQPVQLYRYVQQAGVLSQATKATNAVLGLNLGATIGRGWKWSLVGTYTSRWNEVATSRGIDAGPSSTLQSAINAGSASVNPFGDYGAVFLVPLAPDAGKTRFQGIDTNMQIRGNLLKLPAGQATLSASAGYSGVDQSSDTVRAGVPSSSSYHGDSAKGMFYLNLPLTSRRAKFMDSLGDFSAFVSLTSQWTSNFGTLFSYSYGLSWTKNNLYSLLVSVADDRAAPSPDQLNGPQLVLPNLAVFDYTTGATVLVSQISGANPELKAANRQALNISANIRPWAAHYWQLTVNYSRRYTHNAIQFFPLQSPAIEAAFPDRFIRDAGGNLVSIDTRPTNFASTRQSVIRTELNLPFNLGKPPRILLNAKPRPRLQIVIDHIWLLGDSAFIRQGIPIIDNLRGGAISGFGQSRHRFQGSMSVSSRGLGVTMEPSWTAATRVDGAAGSASALHFGATTNVNLRLFGAFAARPKLIEKVPILNGSTINLEVNNLFDFHQRVTDANGVTPLQFQPERINPIGRTVLMRFRKQF